MPRRGEHARTIVARGRSADHLIAVWIAASQHGGGAIASGRAVVDLLIAETVAGI
jgi:hypothetical protein